MKSVDKFVVALLLGMNAVTNTGCETASQTEPNIAVQTDRDITSQKYRPTAESLQVSRIVRHWSGTPDIDWKATITLARMSAIAYENGQSRTRLLSDIGFTEVQLLDDGPASGLIAISDKTMAIAFRGTDDIEDWIANFKFRQLPKSLSSRHFHSGFWKEYERFSTAIREKLRENSVERVWVTGHSLGGAMATCCAYDLLEANAPLTGVVTFGQPRIGNRALAEYLDTELGDRYLRFMNDGDPVVLMPPGMGLTMPAYWHSGRRAWLVAGILFANQGPTRFSSTAPGVEPSGDERYDLDEAKAPDGTISMTEGDFLELQRNIRAEAAAASVQQQPTAGDSPFGSKKVVVDIALGFLRDRIGEHDMERYLDQLHGLESRSAHTAEQ